MPPAPGLLSQAIGSTGFSSLKLNLACPTATSSSPFIDRKLGRVSVIPRGLKMRVLTKSAHDCPDTCSITRPATAKRMLS